MTSTLDPANIVFGANFHDDAAFDASLNSTISSTFSFGDSDGNVDYEDEVGSVNGGNLFNSPDFTFNTPKRIIEEELVKDSDSAKAHLVRNLDKNLQEDGSDTKLKGPFNSPKDNIIPNIAARFSSSVEISSNSEGTKALKQSTKKPSRVDENENDTTRNIQNLKSINDNFAPFKHVVSEDSARGPGAWFWGNGNDMSVDVDTSLGSSMNSSFLQSQEKEPPVSFSIGQSSIGTYSIRRKKETGRSNHQRKEASPSKANIEPPQISPELNVFTDQDCEIDHTVHTSCDEMKPSDESIFHQFRVQGKKLYEQEDYDNALDAFSNCLAACPGDWSELPGVLGNRAATLMMLERYVEAIEDCNRAVKINPNMLRLLDRKGRAQLKLGMLADAETTFSALVAASSNPILSPSKLNRELKIDAETSKEQVTKALDLWTKMKSKEYTIEVEGVEKLLEICPQMRFAQCMNVRLLCSQQRWNDAKGFAEAVILSSHKSVQMMFAHLSTEYPLCSQTKLDWAEKNGCLVVDIGSISNVMLCMGSNMAQAYILALKNAELSKKFPNDAMNIIVRVLKQLLETVREENEWSWVEAECTSIQQLIDYIQAIEHKTSSKLYDEAIKHCTDALKSNHEAFCWNARLYYTRATLHMQVEKYTEAVHDCHQSVARDASNHAAVLCRARANRALGNIIISTRDYRKYLSVQPRPDDFEAVDAEVDVMLEEADDEPTFQSNFINTSCKQNENNTENFQQFESTARASVADRGENYDDIKFSMGTFNTPSRRNNNRRNRDNKPQATTTAHTTQVNNVEKEDEVNFGSPASDMEVDEGQPDQPPQPTGGNMPFTAPPGPPPFTTHNIPRPPMPPPPPQTSESTAAPLFSMGSSTPKKKKGTSSNTKASPLGKKPDNYQQPASKNNLDFIEQFRVQGKKLYEQEDYDNALDAFSNCLAACPGDWSELPGVLGNRAATLMMLERYVEAIEDCNRAVKINPNMLRLLDRKGRAQLKLGMLADAETTFHELLSSCKKSVRFDAQIQKDALANLKQIEDSRRLIDALNKWNSDNRLALEQVDRLLEICPHMRHAQTLKGKFLCNLQKWDDAKIYIEEVALVAHETIQKYHSHPRTAFPCPYQDRLAWKRSTLVRKGGCNFEIDRYAICNAMLCMGSDMARTYLTCLKNLSICRNHSSEAMSILTQLLTILASTASDWGWVKNCVDLLKESIKMKNAADEKFRNASYTAAIGLYNDALRKDPEAYRWNAVLYCNRAAAHMNLQMYTEAINDCHQSLARDKQYVKALLRRGRAHRASGNFNSAVTDFQNYLSSQPPPVDAQTVQIELDDIIQMQREQSRGPPPAKSSQHQFHNPKFNANPNSGANNNNNNNNDYSGNSSHHSSSASSQSHGQRTFFRNFRDKNGATGSGSSFSGSTQRPSQRHPFGTRPSHGGETSPPTPPHQRQRKQHQQQRPTSPPRPPPSCNPNDQDHYSQLGLSSKATEKEIRTAYRKLALKYHPDKNKDAGAEEIFKAISTAHAVLSDKDARRKYDLSRPLFHTSGRYR